VGAGGNSGSSVGAWSVQLGLMLGAFAVGTLIAKVAGAEWGTASTFGQMAFAATLVAALLRAP
jgi:hypothetical protein